MPRVAAWVILAQCAFVLCASAESRDLEASPNVQAGDWVSVDTPVKQVVEFSSDYTFTTQDGEIAGTWQPQGADRLILHVDHGDRTYITDDKGKHFVSTDGSAKLIFEGAARWWQLWWLEEVTTSQWEHTNPPTLPPSTSRGGSDLDPIDFPTQAPSTSRGPGWIPHIDPGLVPYLPPSSYRPEPQVPHLQPVRPEVPTGTPVAPPAGTTRVPSGKPIGIGIPTRGQPLPPELGEVPSKETPGRKPGTSWWWQLHRWIQGHPHRDGPYSPPDVPGGPSTPSPEPIPVTPTTHAPVVEPVFPSPDDGIDCHTGLMRWWTWPQEQQRYCCQESRVQCPSRRYDCEEDLDRWQSAWSSEKSAFCCQFEGVGCPADDEEPDTFDCDIRADNLYQSWDEVHKEWCCAEKNVACQDTLEPMPTITTTSSMREQYMFDVSGSQLTVGGNVYPSYPQNIYPQYPQSQNLYPPRGLNSGYISRAEVVTDAPEQPSELLGKLEDSLWRSPPTTAVTTSSSSLLAVTAIAFAATLVLVVARSVASPSRRSSTTTTSSSSVSDEAFLSGSSSGEEC